MAELKFEEALKKLEQIVEGLEQGKIPLEESLKKYEEGIRLAKFCTEKLEEAEKKIEILTKDNSGKLKREPFKANPVRNGEDINTNKNLLDKNEQSGFSRKTKKISNGAKEEEPNKNQEGFLF